MPKKYDEKRLIEYLQAQPDIDPPEYDGSYEMVTETVRAYADLSDYSVIDYHDLNAVYLMAVITSRHSFDRKRETLSKSHLPELEKTRLLALLDEIQRKTEGLEYEHARSGSDGQGVYGMFGTGFYSFKNKTTDQSAKDFIKMCADILPMADDEAIFDRAEQVFTKEFHGMRAAAASIVLHCLKPEVFPIMNGSMGLDNIFEAAGVKLRKKWEISSYIRNARAIRTFRDKNFDFNNYRVFDLATLKIDDFLLEGKKEGKVNLEKLKEQIALYKADFARIKDEETYKWEAIKCFQDRFDIDAPDFASMLAAALEKDGNLLSRLNFYAKRALLYVAEKEPEYVRSMFQRLYDESQPVIDRIKQFEEDAEIYYNFNPDRSKSTYQDVKASSIYLFFRYPEKYYIYLSMKFEHAALQIGYDNIPKHGSMERVQAYYDMADQIWEYVKTDAELMTLSKSRITPDCYEDPTGHVLAEDLIYFLNRQYKDEHPNTEEDTEEYYPSLEEYNPSLTAEQIEEVLSDESVIRKGSLDTLYYLYKMGGEGTCKQIANAYGNSPWHYNSNAIAVAKKVVDQTGCPIYTNSASEEKYWPVLFVGKNVSGTEGVFSWKLREPVEEAIKNMDEKGLFNEMTEYVEYPKNMILYGPPGTGKTYHSVLYAVAIVEGRTFDEVCEEKYADVKSRYDAYSEEGKIAFTTFHQSYGYEEFIEGIRPVIDSQDSDSASSIQYDIEAGVFKSFCEKALAHASSGEKDVFGFNSNPSVWKVSLDGTGDNPVREECLQNGHIRIGWDEYGQEITDETDFSSRGGKSVLNAFINKMRKGDIILSCYSASTIDAIGVVTSEYEWHPEYDRLKRVREVKWLAKGLRYDIVQANNGANMTLSAVYQLHLSVADVLRILDEVQADNNRTDNDNPDRYVFIIDEINRGNISKVFGELITLIEDSKRIGQKEELLLTLPYSKQKFGVPSNVYIIGTMNTADRSIALMDTALRRRFEFIEMQPDLDVLSDLDDVEGVDVPEMLRIINERIEILIDREHTLGHSYFLTLKEKPTIDGLKEIFLNRIIPLLQEYFYDDYTKIRLVLADNQKEEGLQFVTRKAISTKDLFGNVEEDYENDVNYIIRKDVFDKADAYIGIYSQKGRD